MALIEEHEMSLRAALPAGENGQQTLAVSSHLDDYLAEVSAPSGLVVLSHPTSLQARRDSDVQAVSRLVAQLVHPSNPSRFFHTEEIPIPPQWNHHDQDHPYSHGTIGVVLLDRSGMYHRSGEKRRGSISWSAVYLAPGSPSEQDIFTPDNLTRSELKLREINTSGRRRRAGQSITTHILPTVGEQLDITGILQIAEKAQIGDIARGLVQARPLTARAPQLAVAG
jgi:hypothetical protein